MMHSQQNIKNVGYVTQVGFTLSVERVKPVGHESPEGE
jgi:hypothetical protein